MEIKINIEAPGLEQAITSLAEALTASNFEGAVKAPEVETAPAKEIEKPKKVEAKQVEPEPEPVEEKTVKETPGLTMEQVRVKLAQVSQSGKQQELKELISSFGVSKLSDIPKEKYAELLEKADDL